MTRCPDCGCRLTCGKLCWEMERAVRRVETFFDNRIMRFADMNDFQRTDVSIFVFSGYPSSDRYDEESKA